MPGGGDVQPRFDQGRLPIPSTVVVIVDDDEVNRRGMGTLLSEFPDIHVLATLTHAEAFSWMGWRDADVALIDAADDRIDGDQFPGVAVVERIRALRSPAETRVVVITGHFFDDAVRRRMREARADFFYHRAEVSDAQLLRQAVQRPRGSRQVPGWHDAQAQFPLGISNSSRVNRGVAYSLEHGDGRPQSQLPQPQSRAWMRWRRDFNRQARLTPATRDGRGPDRHQEVPSLPQIARFLEWATKIKSQPPRPFGWLHSTGDDKEP